MGLTIWFTGLSGAGKTTIATQLAEVLRAQSLRVELLDGDSVRANLSQGLGFSKADRDTNIRRIGFVAHLLSRNDVVVIVAAISPYRAVRDEVRSLITGAGAGFIEIYARCSLEELARRDVKGLYAKALRGEIPSFTGVSDPYEEPLAPEVVLDSEHESEEESLGRLIRYLEAHGWLERPAEVA